ncbi:MAG: M20/M25/M40 family metallo-hydrolase [Legionellales bacterium]
MRCKKYRYCARSMFMCLFLLFIENSHAAPYDITKKKLHAHVNFLCSDALEGRLTGTSGEKLATQYIANLFRELGLEPAGDHGTFFQEFNFNAGVFLGKNKATTMSNQQGRNVLAKLKMSPNSARMIVIGAHVDHLGHGQLSGSRARNYENGMIHAGADDNASGVASILEVAAQLSSLKAQGKLHGNKDILFAIWSGEELGILGSSHFVKNYIKPATNKLPRPTLDAVINLDMVGHLRKSLVLQGLGSSTDWLKVINNIGTNHTIPLIMHNDPYLPTDSTSFYLHGIPTLNLFTGAHDNYHTPRDTPDTLNYAGIKKISEFLVELTLALESRLLPMSFQAVEKPKSNLERGFKIYLGTIPDYASAEVIGVKLSGVAKNSPAERAGLQQNDVIVKLAAQDIHDIYDYTAALNALPVGKPVSLKVLRGNKQVALMIIATYRE